MKKFKKLVSKYSLAVTLVSIFVVLGVIFYFIISSKSSEKPIFKYKFSKFNEDNQNLPFVIENKDGTFTVTYLANEPKDSNDKNINESFIFSSDNINIENIKKNSKSPNSQELIADFYSPFLSCNSENLNLFYIVLDISKSVSDSIGQDKYIKELENKLTDILVNEKLKPGDELRIRFLGKNNKENQNYIFVGPNVTYNYSLNSVKKTHNIQLLNQYQDDDEIVCGGKPSLPSKFKLVQLLNSEYTQKLKNPEYMTNVSEVFSRISEELKVDKKLNKFKKVNYIVFTDGDSTDGFSGCDQDIKNQSCFKTFNGMNIAKEDNAYIIWLLPQYRDIFRNIFSNVNVYFE